MIREGSCIDNIFFKSESMAIDSHKITCPFVDHFPLFSSFKILMDESKDARDFYQINYRKFDRLCSEFDWNSCLIEGNPNLAMKLLVDRIGEFVNKTVIKKNFKKKNRPRKPWITSNLIKSINTKERLYKAWQKKRS